MRSISLLCTTTAYICALRLLAILLPCILDPNIYSSHLLMSNLASSTDGAEDQRVYGDEQPATKQTLGPPEDSE